MMRLITSLMLPVLTFCAPASDSREDRVVRVPGAPGAAKPQSWVRWLDARFMDAAGSRVDLTAVELATGAPSGNIRSTYAVANYPVGLFSSGIKTVSGAMVAPMPYLAFTMDADARASVRYIKSVSGKNMQSLAVIPRECPAELAGPTERDDPAAADKKISLVSLCIPLINQIVPDYLKPTDALGVYAHTFVVAVKKPGADTGETLTTKLSIDVLIPDSKLAVEGTSELRSLRMRDRLLITSNDLAGSPRRDFPMALITSQLPPGVATRWRLKFTDLQMTIEEDVFFEMPVAPGQGRLRPNIARGQAFYKRTTAIDSRLNFRLRVKDFYDETQVLQIQPSGVTTAELPIQDPNAPLRLVVMPDFRSDLATMSMSQYVKPYYPVFCKDQAQIFKPEEWRQAKLNIPGFVACDAQTKTKIASAADAAARRITNPVETFFGSFSYKSLSGASLGGLSGVLSARVLISGRLEAGVINPLNPAESIKVGETTFSYAYTLPSALNDMLDVVRGTNVPAGLDVLYLLIPSKGVVDPPNQPDGRAPFPFMDEWSSNVMF